MNKNTISIQIGDSDKWASYMLSGYLDLDSDHRHVSIVWDEEETRLVSNVASWGRGMELSELTVFNGRLLSLDDRTGIVYNIVGDKENKTIFYILYYRSKWKKTFKLVKCGIPSCTAQTIGFFVVSKKRSTTVSREGMD